jgi:hypothetical protein
VSEQREREQEWRRVFTHEAGHAAMAFMLGWLLRDVEALPGYGGRAEVRPPARRDPVRAALDNLQIALAGDVWGILRATRRRACARCSTLYVQDARWRRDGDTPPA